MKCSSIALCSALALASLVLGARPSYAQSAWRCTGEDCPEVIVNDIEDVTVRDWPATQTISVPGLPYSCQTISDRCPHCATKPGLGGATSGVVNGSVPWSIVVSGSLPSFLIGRFTAAANVAGTIQVSADGSTWPGSAISYVYNDACNPTTGQCTEVQAPGGSTGVVDLGALSFTNPSPGLWNHSLTFHFTVPTADIVTSCRVGYVNTFTVNPGGSNVTVSYPAAWTPVQEALAEAIRNQFRRAARLVVTGSP
jgi:hypothetical protein